jgi:hypothetical protein
MVVWCRATESGAHLRRSKIDTVCGERRTEEHSNVNLTRIAFRNRVHCDAFSCYHGMMQSRASSSHPVDQKLQPNKQTIALCPHVPLPFVPPLIVTIGAPVHLPVRHLISILF